MRAPQLVVVVYTQAKDRWFELSPVLRAACAAEAATVIVAADLPCLTTWQSWAREDAVRVLRAASGQWLGRGQIHLMALSDRLRLIGHQFLCGAELTSASSLLQPLARGLDYSCVALAPLNLLDERAEALAALREHGGLVFGIGNPGTDAETASAAANCDSALSVAELCAFFRDYQQAGEPTVGSLDMPEMTTHLPAIVWLLAVRTGREFSRSGDAVLAREVWQRMQALGLHDVPSYLQRLQGGASECDQLSRRLSATAPRLSVVPRATNGLEPAAIHTR